MKIRLLDGEIYPVTRVEVVNGKLEIDFREKSPEELQAIFSTPARLKKIDLLNDENEIEGEHPGWTVYAGIYYYGDTKTVTLIKETDAVQERLTNAEANALEAAVKAQHAQDMSESAATQITDLQMAVCEIFEGMGV